jgi:hypothetical protein
MMQQVYSISPLSFICPRDKSVKHISTLSYTLTGSIRKNTGAQTGGMDMLKDHGENASKAKREMERWQKGLYNTQLQSQSLCIMEKKSSSTLVSRGGWCQTGCRDSEAQL